MELEFNSAANDDRRTAVSLDVLRGQTIKRLAGAQQKLESKGVDPRAARQDTIGDMGLLGTLIMGMIAAEPISAMLHAHFPLLDSFNYVAASPCIDAVSYLRDQAFEGRRDRKLDDYPEGRKRCALDEAKKFGKKFNLVSANQNSWMSYDVRADMACMFELLDMLDNLEKEGVRMMRLDREQPVYDVLKHTTRKMFHGNGAVRTHDVPLMMAV